VYDTYAAYLTLGQYPVEIRCIDSWDSDTRCCNTEESGLPLMDLPKL